MGEDVAAVSDRDRTVIGTDVESFTEWALMRTDKTYRPGSTYGEFHVGDEGSARIWARQYNAPDGMLVLASRRVMRTPWEPLPDHAAEEGT